MLLTEQQLRQIATALVVSIIAAGERGDGNGPCYGICCMSLDDNFSNAVDDLEDDSLRRHDN